MSKYYYNGVLLPEIPADVLAEYPYCIILLKNSVYKLIMAQRKWYMASSNLRVVDCGNAEFDSNGSDWGTGAYYQSFGNWPTNALVWSNCDIPNNSETGTSIYFNGSEPIPEGGQEPDVPEPGRTSGYLIRSGDSIFTVIDGVLTAVDGSLTAELFRTYGVDEIPASDLLVTLADPVVYNWTTADEITPLLAVVKGVPPTPQVIESEDYDMTDETILGIETVIVDASDDCLFAVSFDSGQTWKLHTGENWATLSEGDTGMSPSVLSAITTEDWNAEATTGKFRFRVTIPSSESYLNSLVVDYLN